MAPDPFEGVAAFPSTPEGEAELDRHLAGLRAAMLAADQVVIRSDRPAVADGSADGFRTYAPGPVLVVSFCISKAPAVPVA